MGKYLILAKELRTLKIYKQNLIYSEVTLIGLYRKTIPSGKVIYHKYELSFFIATIYSKKLNILFFFVFLIQYFYSTAPTPAYSRQ